MPQSLRITFSYLRNNYGSFIELLPAVGRMDCDKSGYILRIRCGVTIHAPTERATRRRAGGFFFLLDSTLKMVYIQAMRTMRPIITPERIDEIKGLIERNPEWSRSKLSQELCKMWGWEGENGHSQYPHLKWGNERLPLKGACYLQRPGSFCFSFYSVQNTANAVVLYCCV